MQERTSVQKSLRALACGPPTSVWNFRHAAQGARRSLETTADTQKQVPVVMTRCNQTPVPLTRCNLHKEQAPVQASQEGGSSNKCCNDPFDPHPHKNDVQGLLIIIGWPLRGARGEGCSRFLPAALEGVRVAESFCRLPHDLHASFLAALSGPLRPSFVLVCVLSNCKR